MYRKNSKYSKNNKFNKDCKLQQNFATMFVALLAKIDFIEIACKNLVFKSANIAKVKKKFHCTKKNTQITYHKNSKNNNVQSKQIRLTKKKVLKTLKRTLENFAKIAKVTRNQFFIGQQQQQQNTLTNIARIIGIN